MVCLPERVEIVIVVCSVIGLVFCGVFIGREFGTFENFVLYLLRSVMMVEESSARREAEPPR